MTSKRPGSCSPGWESHPSTAHCRRTRTRTRARADVREYVDRLSTAVPASTHRAYATYWRRIVTEWGDRPIDEPTRLEIRQLCEHQKLHVTVRKNSRGGRSSRTPHISAPLPLPPRDSRQSHPETTNPAIRVANPDDTPAPAEPYAKIASPKSSPSQQSPETIPNSTHLFCDYTSRPPAGAEARSPYGHATSTSTSLS